MADLSPEEITNLLSQHGGDLNARDNYGMSVILIAALGNGKTPNLPVLNYLLERKEISRIDKIDALEMAGAVLLFDDANPAMFPLALQYWRRALALRLMDTKDDRPILKTPTKSKSGRLSEWSTLDQLEKMEQDPDHQRVIQSLLVLLRISSTVHRRAIFKCYMWPLSRFFCRSELDRMTQPCCMSQLLDLFWATLDAFLNFEHPHESTEVEYDTYTTVFQIEKWIISWFDTLSRRATSVNLTILNAEIMQKFVEVLSMSYLSLSSEPTDLERGTHGPMFTVVDMIRILSRLPEMITEQIMVSLREIIRRDVHLLGWDLLFGHHYYEMELHLPSIRFLVRLGVKPNARSIGGNGVGVLHFLALKPESETRDAAARLLLELGAHLDMADNEGRTAADYWLEKNNQEWHRLPDWLQEGVPMLMCLSSRAIRRHRVHYDDETIVPAVLIPFVSLH